MASQRPGFIRTNTDAPGDSSIKPPPQYGSSSNTYELRDVDPKTGVYTDVKSSDPDSKARDSDEGEGEAHVATAPIETAGELVTQVLHVDDDPTMNAVTFRTVFLGKSHL